jgi:hypothetical protein
MVEREKFCRKKCKNFDFPFGLSKIITTFASGVEVRPHGLKLKIFKI